MNSKSRIFRFCALLCSLWSISTLSSTGQRIATSPAENCFVVMSWNVENLFDCMDDEDKDDAEFLPHAPRQWTPRRYSRKLTDIAQGISRAGQWQWPMLVAIVEIENDRCANDLIRRTPLGAMGYDYRISSTGDRRGVDVGLLFLADRFNPIEAAEHIVIAPTDTTFSTRPILHVSGRICTGDTLDVFVCHFPSRRGGAVASMNSRILGAQKLRTVIDSIAVHRQHAAFIVMGDLNGDPDEVATAMHLAAQPLPQRYLSKSEREVKRSLPSRTGTELFNLFYRHSEAIPPGTYLFRGIWSQLDQIIVSASCLDGTVLAYVPGSAHNIVLPHSTEANKYSVGRISPKRTYAGIYYRGGPSDHLPVMATFCYRPE